MVRKYVQDRVDPKHADTIGSTAFLLGLLLAVLAGLPLGGAVPSDAAALILVIFGLIVGLLNVKDEEVTKFIIASMAFIVIGTSPITLLPVIGPTIGQILIYVTYFVSPALLIVSVEAIHEIIRD